MKIQKLWNGKWEQSTRKIWGIFLSCGVLLSSAIPGFAAGSGGEGKGEDILLLVTRLVLQIGVMLIAAKTGGEICAVYLKQPGVLGELVAGLKTDLRQFLRYGGPACIIALGGAITPLLQPRQSSLGWP